MIWVRAFFSHNLITEFFGYYNAEGSWSITWLQEERQLFQYFVPTLLFVCYSHRLNKLSRERRC